MKEDKGKPASVKTEKPIREVRKSMTVARIPPALKPQAQPNQPSILSSGKEKK